MAKLIITIAIKLKLPTRPTVLCTTPEADLLQTRRRPLVRLEAIGQGAVVADGSLPESTILSSKRRRRCLSHRAAMVLDTTCPARC